MPGRALPARPFMCGTICRMIEGMTYHLAQTSGDAVVAGLSVVALIVLTIIGIGLGFLPGIIASHRRHRNAVPIWVASFVGMFCTFGIVWFVALIWAFTDNVEKKRSPARRRSRSTGRSPSRRAPQRRSDPADDAADALENMDD